MFRKFIGKIRVHKYKGLLSEDYDISFPELVKILQINMHHWKTWQYKPIRSGRVPLKVYYSNIERFGITLDDFITAMEESKYAKVDDTLKTQTVLFDDWVCNNNNVPLDWSEFMDILISTIFQIHEIFLGLPDKNKKFYHRNSYMLRKDIQVILRTLL